MQKESDHLYQNELCECGEERIKGYWILICKMYFIMLIPAQKSQILPQFTQYILKFLNWLNESSTYSQFLIYLSNVISHSFYWYIYPVDFITFSQTCYSYSYLYLVAFTIVLLEIINSSFIYSPIYHTFMKNTF